MDAAHTAKAGIFSMKKALREQHRATRRAREPGAVQAASDAITRAILALPELLQAETIGLYQALPGEIRTDGLATVLESAGKRCVFPRMVEGSRVLAFAPIHDSAALVPGRMGILEPPAGDDVSLEEIDLFVVPGLAFDPTGGRLGQGAGYYDATLAAAPWATRVGVAFDDQLLAQLPMESHDQHVDVVVTPSTIARPPSTRQSR